MKHYLGITSYSEQVFAYYTLRESRDQKLSIDVSTDGFRFDSYGKTATISFKGKYEEGKTISDLTIAKFDDAFFLTYKKSAKNKTQLYKATSDDLVNWTTLEKIVAVKERGVFVSQYFLQSSRLLFFGEQEIQLAFATDSKGPLTKNTVLAPRPGFFDDGPLSVGNVFLLEHGIFLFYNARKPDNGGTHYMVGAALFDRKNPTRLLWRADKPIWDQTWELAGRNITPIGVIYFRGKFISYWQVDDRHIVAVIYHLPAIVTSEKKTWPISFFINRFTHNPIIAPITKHFWESKATFNPAALYEEGKVHIIYRAIGDDDTSVLGYATSRDGVHIDERSPKPVYIPTQPFETPQKGVPQWGPSRFASGGGGYGGCEDPRLTKIGNRIYMTYVAHNGVSHPRSALTSIDASDFLSQKWDWTKSILISPPGVVNKNAVIFPEKINGKFVVMHRIFPNILLDFVDSLDFPNFLQGDFVIEPKADSWDSRKIGAGPPPIKTNEGWLLIYHAVGNNDPSRYKIGAMLLDLENPAKVLYRSKTPLIEPTQPYENEGMKTGVVYPCGAIVKDESLFVYYGGADMVACAATAHMPTLINQLKQYEPITLTPVH